MTKKIQSYADSGVNIDAGNQLIESIKPAIKKTRRPEVMSSIGGFGAAFRIPKHYKNPLFFTATDGVGTKLHLAIQRNDFSGIGIDLVAMCVNDLIVSGAEPLVFLDYYATGQLNNAVAIRVIENIAKGCELAGCALIGGETAEMPGMYAPDLFDLAGFSIGVVEEEDMIDGRHVQSGDLVIGLPSSGIHSNGYSLVNAILKQTDDIPESVNQKLLMPTKIYVKTVLQLSRKVKIKAIAHITGGGMTENLPRVLPPQTQAQISLSSWQRPDIFQWLQQQGQVAEAEMLRVFNCGIGMILVIAKEDLSQVADVLNACGESFFELGEVKSNPFEPSTVEYNA